MKRLVPIPLESAKRLEEEKEVGPGYHFVSVSLKDGRNFESAVASEGFIIQVKVTGMSLSHRKKWNPLQSLRSVGTLDRKRKKTASKGDRHDRLKKPKLLRNWPLIQ